MCQQVHEVSTISPICFVDHVYSISYIRERVAVAWWLIPWSPDPEVGGSSPTWSPCSVFEQDIFTPLPQVLVITKKRWLRPNMTEKLLTGTLSIKKLSIMITGPCNVHPLTSHFYIVKLGFTWVFLIFSLKHRLWVLVRNGSNVYSHSMFRAKIYL